MNRPTLADIVDAPVGGILRADQRGRVSLQKMSPKYWATLRADDNGNGTLRWDNDYIYNFLIERDYSGKRRFRHYTAEWDAGKSIAILLEVT